MAKLLLKLFDHRLQELSPRNTPEEKRIMHLGKAIISDHRLMLLLFKVMNIAGKKCGLPATRRAYDRNIARLCRRQDFIELAFKRWMGNISARVNMGNLGQRTTVYLERL